LSVLKIVDTSLKASGDIALEGKTEGEKVVLRGSEIIKPEVWRQKQPTSAPQAPAISLPWEKNNRSLRNNHPAQPKRVGR
jgi:hypothetical protein